MRQLIVFLFTVSIFIGTATSSSAQNRTAQIVEAAEQTPVGLKRPVRPVHTFSIVARDPVTGELGVAVQSHWFSVGPIVPWAEAGVGAVATQSFVDPSYGKLGLDLMRNGRSAPEACAPPRSEPTRQEPWSDTQSRRLLSGCPR